MQIDVELGPLGFSEGGHLLIKRALRKAGAGKSITVTGTAPELEIDPSLADGSPTTTVVPCAAKEVVEKPLIDRTLSVAWFVVTLPPAGSVNW